MQGRCPPNDFTFRPSVDDGGRPRVPFGREHQQPGISEYKFSQNEMETFRPQHSPFPNKEADPVALNHSQHGISHFHSKANFSPRTHHTQNPTRFSHSPANAGMVNVSCLPPFPPKEPSNFMQSTGNTPPNDQETSQPNFPRPPGGYIPTTANMAHLPRHPTAHLPRHPTVNLPRHTTANLPRHPTANLPWQPTANFQRPPTALFPRQGNNVPEFPEMPNNQMDNSHMTFNNNEQHPNFGISVPPPNFVVSGMNTLPPNPRSRGEFEIEKQMLDFPSRTEHERHFTHVEGPRKTTYKIKKEESEDWVQKWLKQLGKTPSEEKTKLASSTTDRTLKICDAQERVKQVVFLLAKLKRETASLESCFYGDYEWKIHAEEAARLQSELKQHQEVMMDERVMSDLQQKILQRRNKRLRQKQVRKERYEEEMEMTAEQTKMVDNCQARIQKEELNKKEELEMKAAADSTLSEVRKKIADAAKTVDLLKGLQKLRKLRKDRLSKQGIVIPTGTDNTFEEQTTKQIQIMQSQNEIYLAEEKTLKVMLEVEQKETKEKERERLLRVRQKAEERTRQQEDIRMFGPSDPFEEDDPMFPYCQYYDQADQNFEAFVQIRRDWDMFLVPEMTPGGSRIPDGFIVPTKPSSDTWRTALKDE